MAEFDLETSERATKDSLKTHYYKASYDEIKACFLEYLKKNNYEVVSINDDYLEIYATLGLIDVTAKIVMQTPKETSIDFHVYVDALFGAGKKAQKIVDDAYEAIGKKFELKGLSLHAK